MGVPDELVPTETVSLDEFVQLREQSQSTGVVLTVKPESQGPGNGAKVAALAGGVLAMVGVAFGAFFLLSGASSDPTEVAEEWAQAFVERESKACEMQHPSLFDMGGHQDMERCSSMLELVPEDITNDSVAGSELLMSNDSQAQVDVTLTSGMVARVNLVNEDDTWYVHQLTSPEVEEETVLGKTGEEWSSGGRLDSTTEAEKLLEEGN